MVQKGRPAQFHISRAAQLRGKSCYLSMQLPADCWGSSGAGKDLSSVINIEAARDRLLSRRPPTRTRVLYSRLSAAHSQLIDWLIATAIPSACCRRIVERGKSRGEYRVINGTPPTSRRFEGSNRKLRFLSVRVAPIQRSSCFVSCQTIRSSTRKKFGY